MAHAGHVLKGNNGINVVLILNCKINGAKTQGTGLIYQVKDNSKLKRSA